MEQTEINEIYAEIGKLPIELAPDPTVLGPLYINGVISKCRNHLNRVSQILLRMSRERRGVKFSLAGEETLLAAEKDRLLAEDDDVRRAANIRDREAIANTKLRDRLNKIHHLKTELLDLETVERAVKLIHEELVRTSNEIKTQRSLLHADRVSGAAYGDESDTPRDGKGRALPKAEDIDLAELDALVAEGIQESTEAAASTQEVTVQEAAPPALAEPAEVPSAPIKVEEAPVIEPTITVSITVENPAEATDDDAITKFLSDEPASETPKPEVKKAEKPSTKQSDPDDDFLEGLLNGI